MPVDDLVKCVILRETFVHDVEELSSYVGFDAAVPWGVVPGDVFWRFLLRFLVGVWVICGRSV